MKIFNVEQYGFTESIISSGYPMKTEIKEGELKLKHSQYGSHFDRAVKLGKSKSGSGHDNYLKGLIVQFDLQAPEYFWRQFDRYHFHDYVSSQSKMHCILKFDVDSMCNKYVDKRTIKILNEYIEKHNSFPTEDSFQYVISNCPMGFELTARITSNFLQEKSILNQRRKHKLEEWQYYCNWIESLFMFKELVLGIREDKINE